MEDNAYALMRTEDGKVAFLHSSATQWQHQFNLEIALTKGAIVLSGILSGSKSYGAETMKVTRRPMEDADDPEEETREYSEDPSWSDEIGEFAQAILTDGEILYGTSEDANRTMELVYRIYCADPVWKEQWSLDDSLPDIPV